MSQDFVCQSFVPPAQVQSSYGEHLIGSTNVHGEQIAHSLHIKTFGVEVCKSGSNFSESVVLSSPWWPAHLEQQGWVQYIHGFADVLPNN